MREVNLGLILLLLVLCTVWAAMAFGGDVDWTYDPDPDVEAVWKRAERARAKAKRMEVEARNLTTPKVIRLNEAYAELSRAGKEFDAALAKLSALREEVSGTQDPAEVERPEAPPLPPLSPELRRLGATIHAGVLVLEDEIGTLYAESQRAKRRGEDDLWLEKLTEVEARSDEITDAWNSLIEKIMDAIPADCPYDAEEVAMHYFKALARTVRQASVSRAVILRDRR